MSEALYRKYRSKKLSEIRGQEHITSLLGRSLKRGKISHAYLLTGPRGVGKTSIARILAHEINGLPYDDESDHLDIIEIDAASNNGVEDVRELREKARIAPVSATKKVYIIDEVHMLSKPAFNALLKTLEEPPEHVVFILATTDLEKVPSTIVSRTQRFGFRAITPTDAVKHLKYIADTEKIAIDTDALELIAEHGGGSFRDSISLLDQLQNLTDKNETITREMVEKLLGLAPQTVLDTLLAAYLAKDLSSIAGSLKDSSNHGVPAAVLAAQLAAEIQHRVTTQPELLPLLDHLLEVPKSSRPDLKLLVILSEKAVPKPKSAPLLAEPQTDLIELEAEATKDHPKLETLAKQSAKNAKQASTSTSFSEDSAFPAGVSQDKKQLAASGSEEKDGRSSISQSTDFDWTNAIEHARTHYVAIYSVISKCSAELTDNTLLIYARNNFYKKKLDDSKHRINLTKVLEACGLSDVTIETVPNTKPPKDSQAAKIAAMMGGGEEVSLE